MAIAVEMYFDPTADRAIRQIWKDLVQAGISQPMIVDNIVPHISLGVCDNLIHSEEFFRELKELSDATPVFPVTLSHAGFFTTEEAVAFCGVTLTPALMALHQAFDCIFEVHVVKPWDFYRPARWVPHCTVALGLTPQKASLALDAIWHAPLPIQAKVEQISVVQVSTVSYEQLVGLPLVNREM